MLPDGRKVAAPGSLNSMLSQLSTTFELLGRHGEWDEEARTGNPVRSKGVTMFKSGYERSMREQGYEQGSAVEWTEAEVFRLIAGLEVEAAAKLQEAGALLEAGRSSDAARAMMGCLVADRDAMAASYLWWGLQRGKECGLLRREDLALPDGSLLPLPLPHPLPVGFQVRLLYCGLSMQPIMHGVYMCMWRVGVVLAVVGCG